MYVSSFVVISLFFLCIAVSHFFITDKKWAKRCKYLAAIFGIVGLLSSIVSAIFFFTDISSLDKNSSEWAYGVMTGYFKDVLPSLAVIILILLLSSLFQPKMKIMRVIVTLLSSVLCLVYGYISFFLAENGNVSVTKYIFFFSISFALLIQFCGFFDFKKLYDQLNEKKVQKK